MATAIIIGGAAQEIARKRIGAAKNLEFVTNPISICVAHTIPKTIIGEQWLDAAAVIIVSFAVEIACPLICAAEDHTR
jgi:hypothetical protein